MSEITTERTEPDPVNDRSAGESEGFVELRNITKIFSDGDDEVLAVNDVNLPIKEGEFLVFVGPSGCGKTTTLRCIAGLEEQTEGEIIIDGENVEGKEARERDIAMVFQTYALYPHMTVRENMEYPLKVRGYPKAEKEQRVQETAELLEIPELLDRKPSDLSGGQQQRVALGRALVREPKVFLLDEPLSNLDQKLRVQMRTELNKLHIELDKTSIYVTHDQAEAMTMGDRIAVMNDGQLQQVAPPQTIYHRPRTQFVAGFIGEPEMNLFDAVLNLQSGVVETDCFSVNMIDVIEDKLPTEGGSDEAVTFGIRPEHIAVETSPAAEQIEVGDTATAEVRVIEEMGSNIHLTLRKNDIEYRAVVDGSVDVERGEDVSLVFNLERSHIFDRGTGKNVLYTDATL